MLRSIRRYLELEHALDQMVRPSAQNFKEMVFIGARNQLNGVTAILKKFDIPIADFAKVFNKLAKDQRFRERFNPPLKEGEELLHDPTTERLQFRGAFVLGEPLLYVAAHLLK